VSRRRRAPDLLLQLGSNAVADAGEDCIDTLVELTRLAGQQRHQVTGELTGQGAVLQHRGVAA